MSEFERQPSPESWGTTDGQLADSLRDHHRVFFRNTWPDWIVSERSMVSIEGLTMRGALQGSFDMGLAVAGRMNIDPKDACITAMEMKTQRSLRHFSTVRDFTYVVLGSTPLIEGDTPLYVKDPRADMSPEDYTSIDLMIGGVKNLADHLWRCHDARRDWSIVPANDMDKYVLGEYLNAAIYMVQTHFGKFVEVNEDFQLVDNNLS